MAAKFSFNAEALRDLEKQVIKDIDEQQRRNPIHESDSEAVQNRKIDKWIKDAGYGKK